MPDSTPKSFDRDRLLAHFQAHTEAEVDYQNFDERLQAISGKPLKSAAVLVPFVETENGVELILTLRAEHLKHHAGQISFPGGRMEDSDVSLVATALRESQEEIGLDPQQVEVLGTLSEYYTLTGYCITPVIGWVDPAAKLTLDPSEVAELVRVPTELVFDRDVYEQHTWQHEDKVHYYYSTEFQGHRIWGATAAMILGLSQQLNDGGLL